MDSLILGVHVALKSKVLDDTKAAPNMSSAIVRDIDTLGLNAVQIFTHGPTRFTPNNVDYEEVKKTCSDLDLTVHSPYPATGMWSILDNDAVVRKRKLTLFNGQLQACKNAGAWGLVLHICKIAPMVVAAVMNTLKAHIKKSGVIVLLEMVSNKASDKTYETPEKINALIELLNPKEKYYGFTIDTAHLWGAGVDVTSKESMDAWFNGIKHKDKIKQIHLNGSYATRGSGKDKHAIPFAACDNIWHSLKNNPSQSGVQSVVNFARKYKIPIICEINRGTEAEVVESLETIKNM